MRNQNQVLPEYIEKIYEEMTLLNEDDAFEYFFMINLEFNIARLCYFHPHWISKLEREIIEKLNAGIKYNDLREIRYFETAEEIMDKYRSINIDQLSSSIEKLFYKQTMATAFLNDHYMSTLNQTEFRLNQTFTYQFVKDAYIDFVKTEEEFPLQSLELNERERSIFEDYSQDFPTDGKPSNDFEEDEEIEQYPIMSEEDQLKEIDFNLELIGDLLKRLSNMSLNGFFMRYHTQYSPIKTSSNYREEGIDDKHKQLFLEKRQNIKISGITYKIEDTKTYKDGTIVSEICILSYKKPSWN